MIKEVNAAENVIEAREFNFSWENCSPQEKNFYYKKEVFKVVAFLLPILVLIFYSKMKKPLLFLSISLVPMAYLLFFPILVSLRSGNISYIGEGMIGTIPFITKKPPCVNKN